MGELHGRVRTAAFAVVAAIVALIAAACSPSLNEIASMETSSDAAAPTRERVTMRHARTAALHADVGGLPGATDPNAKEYDVVTVMWGTNRESAANANGETAAAPVDNTDLPKFTAKRAGYLTTGYAKITVPKKNRAVGEIPLASEYTLLNHVLYKEDEDPREHFTVGEGRTLTRVEFVARGNAIATRSRNYAGHAFVYVHGFWNSFEDSLYRSAQLAYDMGFDGVPYTFAWPSKGTLAGYLYDRDSVDASQQQFLEFLDLISKTGKVKKIHIIAHSMGARLVVDSLFPAVGPSRLAQYPKIDQIVLAAADVDASVMRARTSAISANLKSITLYASDRDEALMTSKAIAGSAPRAGELRNGKPFIMKGVETIDISSAGTLVFIGNNHSKFATSNHILRDIALLMKGGVHPPDVRFPVFVTASAGDGKYWRYVNQ